MHLHTKTLVARHGCKVTPGRQSSPIVPRIKTLKAQCTINTAQERGRQAIIRTAAQEEKRGKSKTNNSYLGWHEAREWNICTKYTRVQKKKRVLQKKKKCL